MTGGFLTAAADGAVNPLWYASRAGGTVALLLLTASVVLGVAVAGETPAQPADRPRIARFEIGLLHRNLALLATAFLLVHILTAVTDPFVRLGWAITIVPFAATYRPLWLGLGTVAFDLLIAVLITSALRLRLGRRRWKTVHGVAYGAWLAAIVHAVGTGTDTGTPLQLGLYGACVAATCGAAGWRLWRVVKGRRGRGFAAGRADAIASPWPPSRAGRR